MTTLPNLATLESFALLAGASITNTGVSVITGDIGIFPGTSLVGFSPGGDYTGDINLNDTYATQAQSDLTLIYNDLVSRTADTVLTGNILGSSATTKKLSGGGVYKFDTTAQLTGILTLSGTSTDVFIFQIGTTLTTAAASQVILTGGVTCNHVFWQIGTSLTVGAANILVGNFIVNTTIAFGAGNDLDGRLLARGGSITIDSDHINIGECSIVNPTVHNLSSIIIIIPNGTMEITDILSYGLSNVKFLSGYYSIVNTSTWDASNFTSDGKPQNNLTKNMANEQIIVDINTTLPEGGTTNPTIFEQYPELLQTVTKENIEVDTTEIEMYFTFIDEGTDYQNAIGYYFYYIDTYGNPKILTNDPTTNADSSLGYYYPTIIFPNSSRLGKGGSLLSGHMRKLRGNLANKKFHDINVGFFLIPDGWSSSTGITNKYNYIIYTTTELNSKYEYNYRNSDDYRNGIHTILFNYNDDKLLLCMEDIERPGGDKDFNDAIFYVTTTPNISTTNIISLAASDEQDNTLKADLEGLYAHIPTSLLRYLSDSSYSYKVVKDIHFTDESFDYYQNNVLITESAVDYFYRIVTKLNWNYSETIEQVTENDETFVRMTFNFTQSNINNNLDGDKLKLYLLELTLNLDNINLVDEYKTAFEYLLDFQYLLEEKWDNQTPYYADYINFFVYDINLSNVETQLNEDLNIFYTNVTSRSSIWGDPHLITVDNVWYMLPNTEGVFELYKDDELIINGDMRKHPEYYDHEIELLREGTFTKNVSFKYKNEYITINLYTLDLEQSSDQLEFIKVSNIINEREDSDNHLYKNAIRLHKIYDGFASMRVVEVANVRFECISYPTCEDLLTAVCFDTRKLRWRAKGKHATGALINKLMMQIVETLV